MKRFLPLFMLTGLLFGQDILNLKSGESFEGTFHEKLGRDILFKAVGDTTMKKFPIWNVETIETKNWGELTYPFDVPISSTYKNPKNIPRKSLGYGDKKFWCYCVIVPLLIYLDLTGYYKDL